MSSTDYEIVSKLRLIALDEAVQRRWRREHNIALAWSWFTGWVVPGACVGMVLAVVWEMVKP